MSKKELNSSAFYIYIDVIIGTYLISSGVVPDSSQGYAGTKLILLLCPSSKSKHTNDGDIVVPLSPAHLFPKHDILFIMMFPCVAFP
jgi:hypothetical protein